MLPPQLHLGKAARLWVVLVLGVECIELRFELAHLDHAPDRRDRQGKQQRSCCQRQHDDGHAPVRDPPVDLEQKRDQYLGDYGEEAQIDELPQPGATAAGRSENVSLLGSDEREHTIRGTLSRSELSRGIYQGRPVHGPSLRILGHRFELVGVPSLLDLQLTEGRMR